MPALTLESLALHLGARLIKQGTSTSKTLTGLATLAEAKPGDLSFFSNITYRKLLQETQASAVILAEQNLPFCTVNALVVADPYLAYAKISNLFSKRPPWSCGIHSSAQIADAADIDATAYVGQGAVICDAVVLGANVYIGANVFVGTGTSIGDNTRVDANAVIAHGVKVGKACHIQSLAVVGGDGFGFARHAEGWHPIEQLGGVTLGDRVHVGAGTTIDRGALSDTQIGSDVIIDNQVQIAHNVVIGEGTAIAGCVGIAGSTRIGKDCTIAGFAGIAGHLEICDQVHVGMQAQVTNSILKPGSYASGTGLYPQSAWRRLVASWRRNLSSKTNSSPKTNLSSSARES